jgi:hypothetical protein
VARGRSNIFSLPSVWNFSLLCVSWFSCIGYSLEDVCASAIFQEDANYVRLVRMYLYTSQCMYVKVDWDRKWTKFHPDLVQYKWVEVNMSVFFVQNSADLNWYCAPKSILTVWKPHSRSCFLGKKSHSRLVEVDGCILFKSMRNQLIIMYRWSLEPHSCVKFLAKLRCSYICGQFLRVARGSSNILSLPSMWNFILLCVSSFSCIS